MVSIVEPNQVNDQKKVDDYGSTSSPTIARPNPPELAEGHLARPLKCYDPFLVGNKIAENQYDDFDEFLADVDMVVIMVKQRSRFLSLPKDIKQNWDKLKGKVVFDCFNICPLEGVYHI